MRATCRMGSAAANSHSFDMTWTRAIGGERINISGTLRTSNTLDLNGARTDSEGGLDLKGKIGSDFNVAAVPCLREGQCAHRAGDQQHRRGRGRVRRQPVRHQKMGAEITFSMPFTLVKSFQFPVLTLASAR